MKGRPRRIEREVAERLSAFFLALGMSPVERIPVLGRSGPDISLNEFGLVVDVKSRVEVPKQVVKLGFPLVTGQLAAIPLAAITILLRKPWGFEERESVLVNRWWEHMDAWRLENCKDGYTALVLHRPGLRLDDASIILSVEDWRRINDRYRTYHHELPASQ